MNKVDEVHREAGRRRSALSMLATGITAEEVPVGSENTSKPQTPPPFGKVSPTVANRVRQGQIIQSRNSFDLRGAGFCRPDKHVSALPTLFSSVEPEPEAPAMQGSVSPRVRLAARKSFERRMSQQKNVAPLASPLPLPRRRMQRAGSGKADEFCKKCRMRMRIMKRRTCHDIICANYTPVSK